MQVTSIPAVEGFTTTGQVRVVLYQSGQFVHAPVSGIGLALRADLGNLAAKDKASLTADVSGTLPIANGGTGSSSAPGALTALGALGATDKAADSAKLDGVTPSAFIKTLLDDADAAAMLTTLGIPSEAGSFTPTVGFSSNGNFAATYTTQTGSYFRLGSMVLASVNLIFNVNAYTTASGVFQVRGLPFVAVGGTGYGFSISRLNNFTLTGAVGVTGEVSNGQNTANFWKLRSGSNALFFSTDTLPPSTGAVSIVGSVAYQIA